MPIPSIPSIPLAPSGTAVQRELTIDSLVEPWPFWHRGAGWLSEDSALRALDAQKTLGPGVTSAPAMVDVGDFRLTSDTNLVVMHDSTVNRTTTGTGTVVGKTLAQFKALTMRALTPANPTTENPPSASEILDKAKTLGVLCSPEMKVSGIAASSITLITSKGLTQQCLFAATALADIDAAKAAGLRTVLWIADSTLPATASIIASKPDYVGFSFLATSVTDSILQQLAAAGIKLGVWTVDNRKNLADVNTRMSAAGLRLAFWASNDVPWVAGSNLPAQTTDPFAAGLFVPGMSSAVSFDDSEQYRGTFVGSGPYRLSLNEPGLLTGHWIMQGWAARASAPASIDLSITYDTLDADTARWAAVCFGCPDDRGYFTGNALATNRGVGYVFILRQTGSMGLFKATADGVANTSLATAVATSAITLGLKVPIKIEFLPADVVKVTRVDTGHSIQATDSTYRGGNMHFGKLTGAATPLQVSFSDVTITP